MADIDKLRAEYEHAEEKAQKLQADKDDALQRVTDKYRDKMRDANQRLADAQKALADAEAAATLAERRDVEASEAADDEARERVLTDYETRASNLGLTLPD